MRKRSPIIYIIIIIIVAASFSWLRHVTIAPLAVIVIIFLLFRNKKKGEDSSEDVPEDDSRAEDTAESRTGSRTESGTGSSTGRTEDTGYSEGKNTIIRCDYCGSWFDTSKHASCPHCGGTYFDDEEWMKTRK